MKLTRKHIGRLFDAEGADGSWCYQLVDVKGGELLFYKFDGSYEIESNTFNDWQPFKPRKAWKWKKTGWTTGRRY